MRVGIQDSISWADGVTAVSFLAQTPTANPEEAR